MKLKAHKMMMDKAVRNLQAKADKEGVRLQHADACGSDSDCAEMGRKKGMKNPENPFHEKGR